ncbi:MAG: hypothetical protein K5866_07805, partial [Treponema sp.]|nr:hypothetical protein [Treponema sp.]
MKKITLLLLAAMAAISFLSCKHDSEEDNTASVSFNISGAQALASSSSSRSITSSRAAGDSSSLVKIKQDGTLDTAVTMEGKISKASLKSIIKSPYTDDVYIMYGGNPHYTYNSTTGERLLDSLVCVHSDGTYTNLLTQATQFSEADYLLTDNETCIVFDEVGNSYIMAREAGGWENYIYKYDPKNDKRETIFSSVTKYLSEGYNDRFYKLMVSKDGQYLYVGGSRINNDNDVGDYSFLRVVDLNNSGE